MGHYRPVRRAKPPADNLLVLTTSQPHWWSYVLRAVTVVTLVQDAQDGPIVAQARSSSQTIP
jgi:hypothetical protein